MVHRALWRVNVETKIKKKYQKKFSRLGPESTLMGERRHKDEVDSADDSDGARAEQEEVRFSIHPTSTLTLKF